MRRPEKSSRLYSELREDILLRRYQPGSLLPRETELAEKLLVSRDTLRSALARLESESLVRRVRGKGTFVSSGKDMAKITFLLPCPASFHQSSLFLTDVFQGVMEAAHCFDCQVETLALSPTNDPEDIDWSKLLNVSGESKVVMLGFWFARIFQFLKNSGCRVVMIHDGTYQKRLYADELSHWVIFEKEQYEIGRTMIRHLLKSGCRKPFFFSHYLAEKEQPRIQGVYAGFQEAGLDPLKHSVALPFVEADVRKLTPIYHQAMDEHHFDGALMDDSELMYYIISSDPTFKCGCFDFWRRGTEKFSPNAFSSGFPLRQLGYDAVTELLKEKFHPGYRRYSAILYDCNGHKISP